MEDHPAKRRRKEEPAEAAQATVAQTREAGQTTSRYNGVSSFLPTNYRILVLAPSALCCRTGRTRSVVWPSGSCELSAMVDLREAGYALHHLQHYHTTTTTPHTATVLVPHVVQQAHATHNTKNDRPGAADGAGVAHLATAGADYGAGGQPTCVYNVRKDF